MSSMFREVGSTRLELTELGKRIIHLGRGERGFRQRERQVVHGEISIPPSSPISRVLLSFSLYLADSPPSSLHQTMQQIHGDIVSECPSTFSLLASSDISPVQAIASIYPGKPPSFTHSNGRTLPEEPRRNVHIIAFQGQLVRTRPPCLTILFTDAFSRSCSLS